MDNLTRDALEAERLGYGCHYGQYKADYPSTKPAPDEPAEPDAPDPRTVRKCKHCAKSFVLPRGDRRQFCSEFCKRLHSAERNRRDVHKFMAKFPEKICSLCGKAYRPTRIDQSFCSRSCAAKHRNHREYVVCPGCGSRFQQKRLTDKYCSRACFQKFTAARNQGKKEEMPNNEESNPSAL